MWRAILLFMLGILGAFLLVAAVSVYAFHDVDKQLAGRWNEAFAGLCMEGVIFTLIIGGGVALLTFGGIYLFHLNGFAPRVKLAYLAGVGITLIQYPWDFLSRALLPHLADAFLYMFLGFAIVVCSIVLVWDAFREKTLAMRWIAAQAAWERPNGRSST